MDLLLSAWMVYLGNFTPEYSLILLIILKSAYEMFTMLQSPQCFVLKSDIYKLGQATDFAS